MNLCQQKRIVVNAIFSSILCIEFAIYSNTLLKKNGFLLVENVCLKSKEITYITSMVELGKTEYKYFFRFSYISNY